MLRSLLVPRAVTRSAFKQQRYVLIQLLIVHLLVQQPDQCLRQIAPTVFAWNLSMISVIDFIWESYLEYLIYYHCAAFSAIHIIPIDTQTNLIPSLPSILAPAITRRGYATSSDEKDLVVIGGGVAGYVAAIKAAQLGLKVSRYISKQVLWIWLIASIGYLYRKAWHPWRNMFECWLYSIESSPQQLPPLPLSSPWYRRTWYRSRRSEA